MSEKFVVNGGLSIPSGKKLEIGSVALSSINVTDYSSSGALATTEIAKQSIPSEFSVATYVNAQLGASNQLNFTTDSDGEFDTEILLATETLSILGTTNEIETSVSDDNTIKVGLPAAVSITTSVEAPTVTDGTATMNNGNITGLGNLTGSADNMLLIAGDDTEYDFSGDQDGTIAIQADGDSSGIKLRSNTDINGTLTVSSNADLNGTLDVSGTVDLAASGVATDIRGTLSVDETATFDVQSVHSAGIQTGGDIISDQDGTDSLGSALIRWADVHTDAMTMEHSARKDFSVSPAGSATTVFTFENDDYKSGKIVASIVDGSGNITACEVLVVSDGAGNTNVVQYGTVSTGDEVTMTWAVSETGTTTTVSCDATGTLKGHYDLQAV